MSKGMYYGEEIDNEIVGSSDDASSRVTEHWDNLSGIAADFLRALARTTGLTEEQIDELDTDGFLFDTVEITQPLLDEAIEYLVENGIRVWDPYYVDEPGGENADV